MNFLFLSTVQLTAIGLAAIRIGTGILFIIHGSEKLVGGAQQWMWLGQQMSHLGITFAPIFWGFCAMLAEFVGGICLTLGFCTRIAALFLICTMLVAISYHVAKGDSFMIYSAPIANLVIFIGLLIAGGGIYSLDHYLFSK